MYTGLQRLVALVGEVEGGRVSLAPLRMEHPLLGTTALQQQVYSHYMRAALPELVKLVGSANVLGALNLPTSSPLSKHRASILHVRHGTWPRYLAGGRVEKTP